MRFPFPGLRFGNHEVNFLEDATLKELRRRSRTAKQSQLLQSCEEASAALLSQGFRANPGLKLANAFSVSERRKELLESAGPAHSKENPWKLCCKTSVTACACF